MTTRRTALLLACLIVGTTPPACGQDSESLDCAAAADRLDQLRRADLNAGRTLSRDIFVKGQAVRFLTSKPGDVSVPGLKPKAPPLRLAVMVWGEVVAGPEAGDLFDLTTHRWQPNETFYLWFKSAVPIQVGLIEIFPIEGKPDERSLPRPRLSRLLQDDPGRGGGPVPGPPADVGPPARRVHVRGDRQCAGELSNDKAPKGGDNNTAPEPDPKAIANSLVEIHRRATAKDITCGVLSSSNRSHQPPAPRASRNPRRSPLTCWDPSREASSF